MLAMLLAVSLMLVITGGSTPVALPPALPVSGAGAVATTIPNPRAPAARVVFDRPLFAPRQSPFAAANGGEAPVLGGAAVAGTVTLGRRNFAVVRRPDGAVSNLAIGGTISGWRLVALTAQGALFVKSGVRRIVAYGAAPSAQPPAEEDAAAQ